MLSGGWHILRVYTPSEPADGNVLPTDAYAMAPTAAKAWRADLLRQTCKGHWWRKSRILGQEVLLGGIERILINL